MAKFKKGDLVEILVDDGPNYPQFPKGKIVVVDQDNSSCPWVRLPEDPSGLYKKCFTDTELKLVDQSVLGSQLINVDKNNMSSLKEKVSLVFKGEPEKSFIRAGVMDSNENLTSEGKDVFLAFLLKKNGADFKKEVIDLILTEEAKIE